AAAPRGERGGTSEDSAAPRGSTTAAAGRDTHGRSAGAAAHASDAAGSAVAVEAPVRITDAETVRLLHPGDRIDVIASTDEDRPARVVAKGVRVARVPKSGDTGSGEGALVVLRVPRETALALAGAAATTRLAVTLC
ncbi:MAG: hypothetical protein ACRDP3_26430, partial [Streptomyces sp.]|uniref:hypothetical protein n=1 Tax=Streptomyces sp. TaxID=1931 RepID=UPI003D6B7199